MALEWRSSRGYARAPTHILIHTYAHKLVHAHPKSHTHAHAFVLAHSTAGGALACGH